MVRPNKLTYKTGFTIVELLIVIIVIGILATIVIVAYNGIQGSARDKSVLSDLDALDGVETDYGIKNNVAGLAWYSGPSGTNGTSNATLNFTASTGNIIDVTISSKDYCIRAYNPSSGKYKTLGKAAIKESSPLTCSSTNPSSLAFSDGGSVNSFTSLQFNALTQMPYHEWTGGVASSADGMKLVAGDDVGLLQTSTDGGVTWTQRFAENTYEDWVSLASSADGTKLVAVDNAYGYIYTSTDSGVTWIKRILNPKGWWHVASSSDGTHFVAAGGDGSMYTSTDSGATWVKRASLSLSYVFYVASSSDGTKLIASVDNGYIYTSNDSGVTWVQQTGSGIRRWRGVSSSSDGTKMVATDIGSNGSGGYIYTSNDSGVTWVQQTGSGSHGWNAVASSADGTKLVACNSDNKDIYSSNDSGVTWVQHTVSTGSYYFDITISTDGTQVFSSPTIGQLTIGTFR
jgi:prepilin-type N-terminal cleavage/methylation domain-containing protein